MDIKESISRQDEYLTRLLTAPKPDTDFIAEYLPLPEYIKLDRIPDNFHQRVVCGLFNQVHTLAIEGIKGSGKSTVLSTIKDRLEGKMDETPVTRKGAGFVSEQEAEELWGDRSFFPTIDLVPRTGESIGESAWHFLQKKLIYTLNEQSNNPGSLCLLDRGPITRINSWKKDQNCRYPAEPMATEFSWKGLAGAKVHVPLPELTVFIDVPPEIAMSRVSSDQSRLDSKERANSITRNAQNMEELFRRLSAMYPDNFYRVDGTLDVLTIVETIIELIEKKGVVVFETSITNYLDID